jgi:transcriptional regulator with XRE-family HTH domain
MSSSEMISQYRKERRLTQERLAESINVSRQTVAMWETAKQLPSDHVATLAARRLNIDEAKLMEGLRRERLHQRVDTLAEQYNATITVKPNTAEEAQQMVSHQRDATQTLHDVTLTVTHVYKSIYIADDEHTNGHGISVRGPNQFHFWHRGEALIIYLLRKNTNDAIKLSGGRYYIEDNLGNRFGSGASGSTKIDDSTEQLGVMFMEYSPEATSFNLRYDVVNGHEADCELLNFENVPIDGRGITKTFGDDVITYNGVHYIAERTHGDKYEIHLTHNKAREVRHVGLYNITDNLGNDYGTKGAISWGQDKDTGVFFERFKIKPPDPNATSLSFKYAFARTVLAFEIPDLPLPS